VPAGSAAPHTLGTIHGCGVLVDAAHPWRSQVPGGNVEAGDHWITGRQGTHSSCAFTHATIRKLLAHMPRTYRGRDVGRLAPRLGLSAPAVVRSRAPRVKAATLTIRDPALGRLRFNALLAGDPQEARQGRLVLFLHGFPETAESFREILPTVARAGYYAVAFSQRGYSPRARPTAVDAYNIINLVGDVTRVAASLGAPTFHLVGHDWGAGVASVTAALYPKLVTSLTVLSTPDPDALSAASANPRSPQHAASHYITTLRAAGSQNRILANGVKGFKALFALGGGALPTTIVDAYARAIATPAALGAAIDWYRANPLPTPRLGPIKVPTLYLWGTKDAVFLRSTANATAAHVEAPYTFCVLSGQGHWLPEDAAEEIAAPLLSQLAGSRLRCPSTSATHRTH
jgi:pimeloyl-ACP methyl ester carboxylesterase